MPSDYASLISDAQPFYTQLDAHNNRAWWLEHKATYDDRLKPAALALLEDLRAPLSDLVDAQIKPKLFRPHRDVRFSKDKTPYKPHLHVMWQIEGPSPQNPVFFFGIGKDDVTVGAGLMGFEKPMLTNWREMLDLDTPRMLGIFDAMQQAGFTFREPALKRVPSAYNSDHPAAYFLRMKSCVATRPVAPDAPLKAALIASFTTLWPLNNLLISTAEA